MLNAHKSKSIQFDNAILRFQVFSPGFRNVHDLINNFYVDFVQINLAARDSLHFTLQLVYYKECKWMAQKKHWGLICG